MRRLAWISPSSNLGTREGQNLRKFIDEGAPNGDYFPMKPGETWMKAMVN